MLTQHPTEPILEALLTNQDANAKSQEQILEHILVQTSENKLEPILEAQLVQADTNAKDIVNAVEKNRLSIEITGADIIKYKGEKGDAGNIFDKLTPEQKAEIKGEKGDTGEKGKDGIDGIKGPDGKDGINGIDGKGGLNGKNGLNGKKGKDGIDGEDGVKGEKGDAGKDGKDGKDIDEKKLKELENKLDFASRRSSSKTVSLIELDDVDLTSATKTNGKYVIPPLTANNGTVSSVSVVTANGISGSVATATTTPAITLTLGAITPSSVQVSGLTASEIVGTDASKNLVSLAVATYPSLTELSYVKGVTSAIQTQLNTKGIGDMVLASVQSVTGLKTFDTTKLAVKGSSTGSTAIASANAGASDYTQTLQAKTGTIANSDDTFYIGTTQVALNRASAALTLAGLTLTTPDIGTPSAGVLTNATGLPIAGLVSSTSTALGVGSIELGHATDTTIARVSAGVISVEGVTVDTASNTLTLTNKRVTPRILSAASYTTDTGTSLNCDNLDEFIVTAQAGALKLNNPTGTPTDGQVLFVAVTGTAARALTYDTQFEASTVALPTTTVTTARLNMLFIWRADTSKWTILAAV